MYRAKRRRIIRSKYKELLYNEYNKENYKRKSRQERKAMAKKKAKEWFYSEYKEQEE